MNKYAKYASVCLLSLALALTACTKGDDGAVLARVNRSKITAADFKRQLEDLDPRMQQAVATDPKARKEFLDDLIGIEVVLQEARRQGLDKDADFKKHQELFKKEMDRRFQEDTRNELFNALLKKELADKLNKVAAPTDQEARAYYEKNLDKMRTPDGRKLNYKDVETRVKQRMIAEKQRDLYLDYAKALKDKAKISVDDKALDETAKSVAQQPVPGGLDLQTPTTTKKDDSKQKQK